MSTRFNGNGTIPTATSGASTRVSIASSTFSTPIIVTTVGNHNFNTDDTVEIEGHAVNTAANGLWTVGNNSPTTLVLNNSIGNGVGGQTGYCIDYEVQPGFSIPDPGEPASMVTLAPILQGEINTIPWHYRNAGKWRIYNVYAGAIPQANNTPPFSTTWSHAPGITLKTLMPYTGCSLDQLLNAGAGPVPVSGPNDLFEINYSFSVTPSSSTVQGCAFYLTLFIPNAAPVNVVSTTNASPVQVQSIAHGRTTGDTVALAGLAVTALNSVWTVTVIDANNYTLNLSSAPGSAGGAQGTGTAVNETDLLTSTQTVSSPASIAILSGVQLYGLVSGGTIGANNTFWTAITATPQAASSSSNVQIFGASQLVIKHYRPN